MKIHGIAFLPALLFACSVGFAQNTVQIPDTAPGNKKPTAQDSIRIRELYFAGLRDKLVNDLRSASDNFLQIIAADPTNDAALYELAAISHTQNKEKEAEGYLRRAIAARPANTWYWLLLADVYKKTVDVQHLLEVFDALIGIDPENEDFYFDKANALYLLEKNDQAEAVYSQIEKKFGASDDLVSARQRLYQKQGKTGQASEELEKLVAENPGDVRNYLQLSELYTKSGKTGQAFDLLQKARQADPQNILVNLALADNYRAQNKPDLAFNELKTAFASPEMTVDAKVRILLSFFPDLKDPVVAARADELGAIFIKTNPSDPKAFSIYGDLLFQEQKLPEAIQSYKKALSLNNQVYMIWEQLVRLELSAQQFDAAVTDGEEALSIFPNQAALYLYTGVALNQKKNYDKAASYLKMAASLELEDKNIISQIYATLGDVYNAQKKFPESDQSYDKSLQADPDNPYTMNNYAYYLSLRSASLDKAEQMSKKSNDLEKNNAAYEDTYAWILFKQKKYKEARTWIEKALKDDKQGSATLVEHYGDILFFLNETELALEQWKLAKTKGSQSPTLDRKINEKNYLD
jgi:tetratricopeptide (TPR) repeat protein